MAISFQGLGNEGRLGNQMFQYAFVRGVAYNRGFDWIIPGPDACLLYTSPSPRDLSTSRMPSSA